MLIPTNYTVDSTIFQEACSSLPEGGMKTAINQPTGKFFYDPWVLKDEYKGTVWETLYNSLPVTKGEARIIILDPGQAYQCHADIDDRYHLNILSDESFLIDLIQEQMHRFEPDGIWYNMDASYHHTAANFGKTSRIQLVVRQLLRTIKITNPIKVTVKPNSPKLYHARYLFDYYISPWLNSANKNGFITDFEFLGYEATFIIEQDQIETLKNYLPEGFVLE